MKFRFNIAALCVAAFCSPCGAQTPEEAKAWEAQHAQAQAEARVRAEHLAHERAARRADPMGWVKTLDPLSEGGWEFRNVAPDGSWALYSTLHQLKQTKRVITLWLRQEFAEAQTSTDNGTYQSYVEKMEYDCGKDRLRPMLIIYYTGSNLTGGQQNQESDAKHTPWVPVVPGTQSETLYHYACSQAKAK